jgi:hypothetical protein
VDSNTRLKVILGENLELSMNLNYLIIYVIMKLGYHGNLSSVRKG